jgi:hypothetical protein
VVRQPAAGTARGPFQPAVPAGARPYAAGAGDCSHTQAGQDHGARPVNGGEGEAARTAPPGWPLELDDDQGLEAPEQHGVHVHEIDREDAAAPGRAGPASRSGRRGAEPIPEARGDLLYREGRDQVAEPDALALRPCEPKTSSVPTRPGNIRRSCRRREPVSGPGTAQDRPVRAPGSSGTLEPPPVRNKERPPPTADCNGPGIPKLRPRAKVAVRGLRRSLRRCRRVGWCRPSGR